MEALLPHQPLYQVIERLCRGRATLPEITGTMTLERLPASRPVFKFVQADGQALAVGKFFSNWPATALSDQALLKEYYYYRLATYWNGDRAFCQLPRLLGRAPGFRLGLLLQAVPGTDLDFWLGRAIEGGDHTSLEARLTGLAKLLAYLHSRPLAPHNVSPTPALRYLAKLQQHLQHQGLLSTGDYDILEREGQSWQERLNLYPDRLVLIHGDATPTNFLFADQTAVALDVERMRVGDRLWDLSWVAGELKHAWGWRRGNWQGSEGAIGHFFRAYFHCLPANEQLAERIFRLNPFYMALAELRIARNSYLSWAYRRELVFEALRCMSGDRGL